MSLATPARELLPTLLKTVAATAAYGVLHSALASRQAKDAAARLFGERHRSGLYRLFYNAQSVVTFVALLAYLLRLPDRVLYRLTGTAALIARLGQCAALLYALAAAWQVGILRITGLASAAGWVRSVSTSLTHRAAPPAVEPEPEAQGPAPDDAGWLRTGGPFRWSRHPLNLVPLPVIFLAPTMTLKRATFGVASAAYLVLGSLHEERRLRRAYGDRYERYRRSGVPFYLPGAAAPILRGARHPKPTSRVGVPMNGQTFVDALRALEEHQDVAPMARLHGPDATIWSPQIDAKELPKRPDGAERFWREYRAAFQHVRSEFLSVTDANGRSVLEWESSGSMRDGSPFTYRGVSVVQWDGDRIQRFATYFDPSSLPTVPQRSEGTDGGAGGDRGDRGDGRNVDQEAQHVEGASYTSPRQAA